MNRIGGLGCTLYFALCVVQPAAILMALQGWLGLPGPIRFIISVLTAYVPLIGQILGTLGAVTAWGWPWWLDGPIFFGLFGLIVFLGSFARLTELFRRPVA